MKRARRRPICAGVTRSRRQPFCKWKAKYGGLEVSEARRLKALEDENHRLKKLLAEAMLENATLKDILGKNG
jgi:putative transposase